MKFGLITQQFELITECISKFPEIEKVILFGSRAMGNYKPASDIDLMICGVHVSAELVRKLSGILNEEVSVPFQFDLIRDYPQISPELKQHIEKHGVEFYHRS